MKPNKANKKVYTWAVVTKRDLSPFLFATVMVHTKSSCSFCSFHRVAESIKTKNLGVKIPC